ncbi:MAG TPA: hypothetical protein VK837_05825 [Longimicrobiales bacterium]|nr:hypothetical protein [Longimicrobiales bacterium]
MTRFVLDNPAPLVRESPRDGAWAGASPWEARYDTRAALGPLRDLELPTVDRLEPVAVQSALAAAAAALLDGPEGPGVRRAAIRRLAARCERRGLRQAILLALRAASSLDRDDPDSVAALCRALRRLADASPGPRSRAACYRLEFSAASTCRLRDTAATAAARLAEAAAAENAPRDAARWRGWAS